MILPGTGRWRHEVLTEGEGHEAQRLRRTPSAILRIVPLPDGGGNYRARNAFTSC